MHKREKKESKKVVVIFIEGATEIAFYKQLVSIMRDRCGGRLSCAVELIDVPGVGRYKNKVQRIFANRIKKKYPNGEFYIALCYDQDVFEMGENPPIDWQDVKNEFMESGAKTVRFIKAIHSIEDWFLCDIEGILRYLHLPSNTKTPGGNGYERLKELFKKGQKMYIKGTTSGSFVQALDIEKILLQNCRDISPLCKLLGVSCEQQKSCFNK